MIETDPDFVDPINTGDDCWCFTYDPVTKRQNAAWVGLKSQCAKKLCFHKSKIKTMLLLFFDSKGVVYKEFVLEGQTVIKEFY